MRVSANGWSGVLVAAVSVVCGGAPIGLRAPAWAAEPTPARVVAAPTPRELSEDEKALLKRFILDTDVDTDEGPAPLTVHFSCGFPPVDEPVNPKFEWDFGDGSPKSREQNPKHTYKKPGRYKAVVRVTDDADQTGNDAFDIEVTTPEKAN